MENEKKDFKIRWISFGRVVSDPWAVVLYLLIGVLIIFYASAKEDYVKSLLTLLFSIVASVLGGIYAKRWSDLNEEKVLYARGISAIRSLKLLLQQLVSVENRARLFFKRNESKTEEELVKLNNEEIIDRIKLLEEQAIGAIENWNDIIPEADVKTQIGIISEIKRREEELEEKISNLTSQKETSEKESSTQTKELRKELEKLRDQLREKEERLNLSGLSGISGPTGGDSNLFNRSQRNDIRGFKYVCITCGNVFYPEPYTLLGLQERCPRCNSNNINITISDKEN